MPQKSVATIQAIVASVQGTGIRQDKSQMGREGREVDENSRGSIHSSTLFSLHGEAVFSPHFSLKTRQEERSCVVEWQHTEVLGFDPLPRSSSLLTLSLPEAPRLGPGLHP